MEKINELVEALYPKYGAPGSRDVDVTASRKAIDESAAVIAEAFRALEQRAEAAEHERDCHMDIAEHFKARCRELEQQKPYGYVHNLVDPSGGGVAASIFKEESRHYGRPVFTRPAPAINLAELVPDGLIPFPSNNASEKAHNAGWNACRAAILRNIEEAK